MTTKLNASVHRKTRFEIRELHQGPNSFGLVCTERGSLGKLPGLEVHESDFTDEEMAQIHAALELLENKFAPVYDAHTRDPARMRELLVEAKEAERQLEISRLEMNRVAMELIAKRAELEELTATAESLRSKAEK